MTIVYISVALFVLGCLMAVAGKLWLTYYGFKYSAVTGILVFLLDFVTLWFAFYKLEKEGKERWVTLWLAGLGVVLVTVAGFLSPLTDAFTGKAFEPGYAEAHEGGIVNTVMKDDPVTPGGGGSVNTPSTTPAATNNAGGETNNAAGTDGAMGTDGAPGTDGATNNAGGETNNAAGTDGAAATDGAAGTDGAAPSATNNAGGETNGAAGTDGGAPPATNNAGGETNGGSTGGN